LTAKQDAWLKAIAAVMGLIGTILGYPLFKRYFDKPEQSPSTKQMHSEAS
jgi:hypothetical protein